MFKFFQVSVSYLQQKLHFDVNLLRNAQFLNLVKQKGGDATIATSNLALKVTSVLENVLGSVFQMESKHAIVAAIRNQWHFFQHEEIPACFVRIDHFWRRIGNLVDEFEAKKYLQLAKLTQCVLH